MRQEKEIEVAGRTVTVKELTVAEIRAWLKEVERAVQPGEQDVVGLTLFEDASFEDLSRMSDATPEMIDGMAPSELREILDAAREINRDFFRMRRRLVDVGRQVLQGDTEP